MKTISSSQALETKWEQEEEEPISSVAITNGMVAIASGKDAHNVCTLNAEFEDERLLMESMVPIHDLSFSADGSLLAICSDEPKLVVAMLKDNTRKSYVLPFAGRCVSFDPEGQYVAVGGRKAASLFSVQDGTLVRRSAVLLLPKPVCRTRLAIR